MPRVLGVALGLLAVSAPGISCASGHDTRSATPAAPPLVSECGSSPRFRARTFWLETSDRVRLYAVEAGRGATTVVLAHQGGSNLCDTIDYARTLLADGLRVVAFDFRGNGLSSSPRRHALALGRDLAAAVERAHDDGARHVFLIGASMGGAAIVQSSAGLPVAGAVSLSGTRLWPGYGINEPGAHALSAPLLYIGGRNDPRAPLEEAHTVLRTAGSDDKRSIFYEGTLHGWDFVEDTPQGARTRALIISWMRARS
jgi:dienelactone hydrolase